MIFFNDVTKVIRSSKCLLHADDLKVYRRIKSFLDCLALQRDLSDAISRWCLDNFLTLNVAAMSYFRIHNSIRLEYKIEESVIKGVTEMLDLAITFTENLSFNRHMDVVIAKAYSMIGFVKRICRVFRNVDILSVRISAPKLLSKLKINQTKRSLEER